MPTFTILSHAWTMTQHRAKLVLGLFSQVLLSMFLTTAIWGNTVEAGLRNHDNLTGVVTNGLEVSPPKALADNPILDIGIFNEVANQLSVRIRPTVNVINGAYSAGVVTVQVPKGAILSMLGGSYGYLQSSHITAASAMYDYYIYYTDPGSPYTVNWDANSPYEIFTLNVCANSSDFTIIETFEYDNMDPMNPLIINGDYFQELDGVNAKNVIYASTATPVFTVTNTDTGEEFCTIQQAIDDVDTEDGHNIVVAAGTRYEGNVNVTKSVTIKGANFGVNGNSPTDITLANGARVAETILVNSTFQVLDVNVKIDGFQFNGASGVTTNGASANAANGLSITNNVFSNLTTSAYSNNAGATAQSNITFSTNRVDGAITPGISAMNAWDGISNMTVNSNYFAQFERGVQFDNASNVTVSNSHFTDIRFQGLQIATVCSNINVLSNTFDNCDTITEPDRGAIRLYAGVTGDIVIEKNVFKNNINAVRIRSAEPYTHTFFKIRYNIFEASNTNSLSDGSTSPTGKTNGLCNWHGVITGPTIATNPGGTGAVLADPNGQVNFRNWLMYGNDQDAILPGFQIPTAITVVPGTPEVSVAENHYRVLSNAVGCALEGQTITLNGTFDWTNASPIAQAEWAKGNDGVATGSDNYRIVAPVNVNTVTLTASPQYSGVIQGPGDLDVANLEAVFVFAGGDNKDWIIENLEIKDVDMAIAFFNGAGGNDAFNNLKIRNNKIWIPKDLNINDAPLDVNQNIGLHFSFGTNQEISGNIFEVDGTGVSAAPNYSSSVVMQSNTSGANTVYDGLKIINNTINITGGQNANPSTILGIWENGHNLNSDIQISGNIFTNLGPGNDPANNLQRAFRVTSKSGATKQVIYENNEVDGTNLAMQWIDPYSYPVGSMPVIVRNNKFDNTYDGILVRQDGSSASIYDNSFTNTGNFAINNIAGLGSTSATCNWYGSAVAATVSSKISGAVNFTPYLTDGTDNNVAIGFQPLPGNCNGCTVGVKNETTQITFCTIQDAINDDLTDNGHTLTVAAGTYAENVIVNKSLTINGPHADDNGCDPRVGAEAIVVPATNAVRTGEIFSVKSSNVTIAGLTIDGDNTSLISGVTNPTGADMNAAEGVAVYDNHINNLTVTNNVFKNLSYFGVTLFGASYSAPATSGHTISQNKFENFGTYNDAGTGNISFWGGGVLLYNSQYAKVTNNCMENVRIGVQTGNYHIANPNPLFIPEINANSMSVRRLGVFYNLHTVASSPYTLSSNAITAAGNANETRWSGILLSSLSVASTSSGNSIDGSGTNVTQVNTSGYQVWNVKNTFPAIISGGSAMGVDMGLFLNNFEGYSSDAGDGAHATVTGLAITPKATGTGIRVLDSPSSTSHANVQLQIGLGNSITGGSKGLLIENTSASIVDGTLSNLDFVDQTGNYIELVNNAGNLLATSATFSNSAPLFTGVTGNVASLTANFTIEDKIVHDIDNDALGFVRVKDDNVFVTTQSFIAPATTTPSIQRGINAADPGDLVNVRSGNYGRQTAPNSGVLGGPPIYQFGLNIEKAGLTIRGYDASDVAVVNGGDAAVEFTTGATNSFGASGIFIQADDVTLEGLKIGNNLNDLLVINNNKTFEFIGDNFTITKCWIHPDNGAIYLGEWDALHPITAYSITNNKLENTLVSVNNGVGLSGPVSGRLITGNEFVGVATPYLIGFRGWNGPGPVQGWIVKPVGGAIVTGNTFSTTGVVNYVVARGNAGGYLNNELDWEDIWNLNTYSTSPGTGNHVVTLVNYPTDFIPRSYLDAGGYPESRRISPFIQENINIGENSDVVLISTGTFNERLTVNKSLTLLGVDKATTIIDGTSLGLGSGITLNNGITGVTIKNLAVQKFLGTNGNSHAGIYAIGGNNNLTIDAVAMLDNPTASGFYANGPINTVSITNSMVTNNGSDARGIVIWNGFKQNITISNNMVTNNRCCGIELQDGTASNVDIIDNIIDVGNGDNAIGLLGLNGLTGDNLIQGNIITGGGRFGIEIKNPDGDVTVNNNMVTLTTVNSDLRDRAGIAVFRRDFTAGNPAGYVDIPHGVSITNNTVTGYTQSSSDEGFGIVVEGVSHNVTDNTLVNNDVGLQLQGGGHANPNYVPNDVGSGNQDAGMSPNYFGRGNTPYMCDILETGNTFIGNTIARRMATAAGVFTDISGAGLPVITNQLAKEVKIDIQVPQRVYCSIQKAVDASIGNGLETVQVSSGATQTSYDEQVLVNKDVTILGVGATKPIVDFTGTPALPSGRLTLFDINRTDVTIQNLNFKPNLSKVGSAIIASDPINFVSGLVIQSNDINPYRTIPLVPLVGYGSRNAISINFDAYRVNGKDPINLLVDGNTITYNNGGTPLDPNDDAGFRTGIGMDGGSGTFSNNTSTAINHDFITRFANAGAITVNDNDFYGGGAQFGSFNGGAGLVTISNNLFDNSIMQPASGNIGTGASLRLIYFGEVVSANNDVLVTGNTFQNHRWGVSVENFKNVTFDNNTFTPKTGSTDYIHMTFNTKIIASTSAASGLNMFAIGATLTDNTFNNSTGSGGTALAFYNHRSTDANFTGTYTIGTPANENIFNNTGNLIGNFIKFDNSTGPSSGWVGFNEYATTPSTTMDCWSKDINIENNKFVVGGLPKLPINMTSPERATLESKLIHKPDFSCLGKLTYFQPLVVNAKVFLQGPYNTVTSTMADDLRKITIGPLFPLSSPYDTMPDFMALEENNFVNEVTTADVLDATCLDCSDPANNAIVDWVWVELRDPMDENEIVATRSALLQRDGDIVDMDGNSKVQFPDTYVGNYFLMIRHRNHLGAMTNASVSLNDNSTLVDFSDPALVTKGATPTSARKLLDTNVYGLWAGNVNQNDTSDNWRILYNGSQNDRNEILKRVGTSTPLNIVKGYYHEDVNLNGETRYTGANNDRVIILNNLGASNPLGVITQEPNN
jgi:hypothetical protein